MKIYFFILFIVIYGQPCCKVNLSRPFISLVTPVFWNNSKIPLAANLNIPKQVWIFCQSGYSYNNITIWFSAITNTHLAFSEKFVNFMFVQIFNSWRFSLGNETRIYNTLISNKNIDLVIHVRTAKTITFPFWNLRLLSSSLAITMIYVCVRFPSVNLNGVSKSHARY